jgi:hypothetical protein
MRSYKLFSLIMMFSVFALAIAQAPHWRRYESKDHLYTAEFPADPVTLSKSIESVSMRLSFKLMLLKLRGLSYVSIAIGLPKGQRPSAKAAMDEMQQGFISSSHQDILSQQDFIYDGMLARQVVGRARDGYIRGIMGMKKNGAVMFLAAVHSPSKEALDSEDSTRFLTSIKLK